MPGWNHRLDAWNGAREVVRQRIDDLASAGNKTEAGTVFLVVVQQTKNWRQRRRANAEVSANSIQNEHCVVPAGAVGNVGQRHSPPQQVVTESIEPQQRNRGRIIAGRRSNQSDQSSGGVCGKIGVMARRKLDILIAHQRIEDLRTAQTVSGNCNYVPGRAGVEFRSVKRCRLTFRQADKRIRYTTTPSVHKE